MPKPGLDDPEALADWIAAQEGKKAAPAAPTGAVPSVAIAPARKAPAPSLPSLDDPEALADAIARIEGKTVTPRPGSSGNSGADPGDALGVVQMRLGDETFRRVDQVFRNAGVSTFAWVHNAHRESGGDPGAVGDSGKSHGLFQFHEGGVLGDLTRQYGRQKALEIARDPLRAAEIMARLARQHGVHEITDPHQQTVAFTERVERPAKQYVDQVRREMAARGGSPVATPSKRPSAPAAMPGRVPGMAAVQPFKAPPVPVPVQPTHAGEIPAFTANLKKSAAAVARTMDELKREREALQRAETAFGPIPRPEQVADYHTAVDAYNRKLRQVLHAKEALTVAETHLPKSAKVFEEEAPLHTALAGVDQHLKELKASGKTKALAEAQDSRRYLLALTLFAKEKKLPAGAIRVSKGQVVFSGDARQQFEAWIGGKMENPPKAPFWQQLLKDVAGVVAPATSGMVGLAQERATAAARQGARPALPNDAKAAAEVREWLKHPPMRAFGEGGAQTLGADLSDTSALSPSGRRYWAAMQAQAHWDNTREAASPARAAMGVAGGAVLDFFLHKATGAVAGLAGKGAAGALTRMGAGRAVAEATGKVAASKLTPGVGAFLARKLTQAGLSGIRATVGAGAYVAGADVLQGHPERVPGDVAHIAPAAGIAFGATGALLSPSLGRFADALTEAGAGAFKNEVVGARIGHWLGGLTQHGIEGAAGFAGTGVLGAVFSGERGGKMLTQIAQNNAMLGALLGLAYFAKQNVGADAAARLLKPTRDWFEKGGKGVPDPTRAAAEVFTEPDLIEVPQRQGGRIVKQQVDLSTYSETELWDLLTSVRKSGATISPTDEAKITLHLWDRSRSVEDRTAHLPPEMQPGSRFDALELDPNRTGIAAAPDLGLTDRFGGLELGPNAEPAARPAPEASVAPDFTAGPRAPEIAPSRSTAAEPASEGPLRLEQEAQTGAFPEAAQLPRTGTRGAGVQTPAPAAGPANLPLDTLAPIGATVRWKNPAVAGEFAGVVEAHRNGKLEVRATLESGPASNTVTIDPAHITDVTPPATRKRGQRAGKVATTEAGTEATGAVAHTPETFPGVSRAPRATPAEGSVAATEPGAAESSTTAETVEPAGVVPGTRRLMDAIRQHLEDGGALNNPQLTKLANEAFGGTISQGSHSSRDKYDALEAAVNGWIEKHGPELLKQDPGAALTTLRGLVKQLPRQDDRTEEQVEFQQFSTPPTLAYLAAKALNLQPGDVVLEPSAGVGGLASWARAAGAKTVHANEISPRRAGLLRMQGYQPTEHDAEILHDLLEEGVQPTAVLMNPPFSATGGRVKQHKTEFGAEHVRQALLRLQDGGRLVAIVGRGMGMDRPTFRKWWEEIAKQYHVRANLGIPGDEYGKYGTTFDNQLLVIEKTGPTPGATFAEQLANIRHGDVSSLEEALHVLNEIGVTNERPTLGAASTGAVGARAEQPLRGTGRAAETTAGGGVVSGAHGGTGAGSRVAAGQGGQSRSGAGTGAVQAAEPGATTGPVEGGALRAGDGSPAAVSTGERVAAEPGKTTAAAATPAGEKTSAAPREKKSAAVTTGRNEEAANRQEEAGGRFVSYVPAKLTGGRKHPANIVEAASMAAVDPPAITYEPHLPPEVVDEGKLSNVQLEAVLYAGQRHSQILPNGHRAGFFVGDGTGVGKGREIAGILLDNWNQGRRRALWVSVSADLIEAADRDLKDLGAALPLQQLNETPLKDEIAVPAGVIFSTYDTFRNPKRLEQLKRWLGEDGILIFDEAHKAKNAAGSQRSEGTQTGLAVIRIQDELPQARVVYVSATGATNVKDLAYATRLGLWGSGTAFPGGFTQFMQEIERGGVGSMELVARDLKALGEYVSRFISFDGVGYRRVVHTLTPEQERIYDVAANTWQVILQNIDAALNLTNADANARRNAMTRFWNDHQRFFRQLITAVKVPTLLAEVEKELAAGHSAVIGILGTGEARTEQLVAKAGAEGTALDELDFSPREVLANLVQRAFPTQLYREETDPATGKTIKVAVVDKEGNPVQSREAVAMRERLLDDLSDLSLPENPLDQIITHFGEEKVAELTGREKRLVRDPKSGKVEYRKRAPEGVAMKRVNLHEMEQFQSGRKRIAIISSAASTGISLHASNRAENRQKRVHFTLELGWSADQQMQFFGRTHRSDQAQPPEYVLLGSNVGGEVRFVSTIAKRLASLGALTKGQRDASSGGGELEEFNFETAEGEAALTALYRKMRDSRGIPGLKASEQALRDMGILRESKNGEMIRDTDMLDVPRFLNRILALDLARQNAIFEAYVRTYQQVVEMAKETGTFDAGVEDIRAVAIRLAGEPEVVHTDATTGAETYHYTLEADRKTNPVPWERVHTAYRQAQERLVDAGGPFFAKQKKTGRVIFVRPGGNRTDPRTGAVTPAYKVTTPKQTDAETLGVYDFWEKWEKLDTPAGLEYAEATWNEAYAKVPKVETDELHVIGGAILPLWNRLKTAHAQRLKVVRASVDGGRRVVGILIPNSHVGAVLRAIGITRSLQSPEQVYRAVWEQGDLVPLVGGLEIRKSRLRGEDVIELAGATTHQFDELRDMGLVNERIEWKNRFFVPSEELKALDVLKQLLDRYPAMSSGTEAGEAHGAGDAAFALPSTGPLTEQQAKDTLTRLLLAEMGEGPQPLLHARAAPFYSQLERAIEAFPAPRTLVPQLRGWLTKQGVKPEETRWTGLDDLLESRVRGLSEDERTRLNILRERKALNAKEGRAFGAEKQAELTALEARAKGLVTKAELLEFLRRSAVEVHEIEKTGAEAVWEHHPQARPLPGGQQYRELLLTLPEMPEATRTRVTLEDFWKRMEQKYGLAQGDIIREENGRLRTLLGSLDREEVDELDDLRTALIRGSEGYHTGHWEEKNVLAHVRFDERQTADGKRTLHLTEVQSDWHQAGRKEGYLGDLTAFRAEVMAAARERGANMLRVEDAFRHLAEEPLDTVARRTTWAFNILREATGDTVDLNQFHDLRDRGVPAAPFAKTWHELVLRRMVRWAAENGFDALSWDSGATNADRYDLSKQVKHIAWERNDDGTYNLNAPLLHPPADGSQPAFYKEDLAPAELTGIVGKEIAEKILAGEGEEKLDSPYRDWRVLKGEDLKVGGAGMVAFYDRMLPAAAGKLGKRWGAKVGETRLAGTYEVTQATRPGRPQFMVGRSANPEQDVAGPFDTHAEAEAALKELGGEKAWSLEITEGMRNSVVQEGLPLFQGGQVMLDTAQLRRAWDAAAAEEIGGATAVLFDYNDLLGEEGRQHVRESPFFQKFVPLLVRTARAFSGRVLTPAEERRVVKVGLLFAEDPSLSILGMNWQDPTDTRRKSVEVRQGIFLDLFAHLDVTKNTPHPPANPRALAEDFVETILHELAHVLVRDEDTHHLKAQRRMEERLGDRVEAAVQEFEALFAEGATEETTDAEQRGSGYGQLLRAEVGWHRGRFRRGTAAGAGARGAEANALPGGSGGRETIRARGGRQSRLTRSGGSRAAEAPLLQAGELNPEGTPDPERVAAAFRRVLETEEGRRAFDAAVEAARQSGAKSGRAIEARVGEGIPLWASLPDAERKRLVLAALGRLAQKGDGAAASRANPVPGSPVPVTPRRRATRPAAPVPGPAPSQGEIRRAARYMFRLFAPVSSGGFASKETAGILREKLGEQALEYERTVHALEHARKTLERLGPAANYQFIDDIENGRPTTEPELQPFADALRKLLDQRRDLVQKETGKLQTFYEHYFPHVWEKPHEAENIFAQVMGRRPLEGPKGFLKRRSIPLFADGIAAGLKPVSDNAVDLVLAKLLEMDRFLLAHRTLREMKEQGLARYFRVGAQVPSGWVRIADPIGVVHGPPEIEVTEAYDQLLFAQLVDFAQTLGIDVERVMHLRGKAWGRAFGGKVVTRFGGPETMLTHELGHEIDRAFHLTEFLIGRSDQFAFGAPKPGTTLPPQWETVRKELDALAALRHEGTAAADLPPAFLRYIHNRTELVANLIHAVVHAPEKAAAVAPTTVKRFKAFLKAHPELKPLLTIKPSLVLGENTGTVSAGGLVIAGNYYAPEGAALILNNHLSPGLRGVPLFQLYRGYANLLNSAQLGLSFFHGTFVSVDAAISRVALGLKQIAAGKPIVGAASVVTGTAIPLAAGLTLYRGNQVLREYFNPGRIGPEAALIVEAMATAGGRARMDAFYRIGAGDALKKTVKRAGEYARQGKVVGATAEAAKTLPLLVGTFFEKAALPLMEWYVPRLKAGAFADLARFEMERLGPTADPRELRTALQRAWDSVDNRMGQLVYDDLFWNRALKDLGMASVRSLGWNLGTIRELGGGYLDLVTAGMLGDPVPTPPGEPKPPRRPELTHRAAYVIALHFVLGLMGALLMYLLTGKRPETLEDYFFPRTGRTLPSGKPERLSLPGYVKDEWAWAKQPALTAQHKMNPALQQIIDLLQNRDFFNVAIRNPDDPLAEQAKDVLGYLIEEFKPITFRNAEKAEKAGKTGLAEKTGSFLGLTEAPRYVDRTRAEEKLEQLLARRRPEGPITQDEFEEAEFRRGVVQAIRTADPEARKLIGQGLTEGTLDKAKILKLVQKAGRSSLQAGFALLPLIEALEVLELADPEERLLLKEAFVRKLQRGLKKPGGPEKISPFQERIRRALRGESQRTGAGTPATAEKEGARR
jgi:hypothetical protein